MLARAGFTTPVGVAGARSIIWKSARLAWYRAAERLLSELCMMR